MAAYRDKADVHAARTACAAKTPGNNAFGKVMLSATEAASLLSTRRPADVCSAAHELACACELDTTQTCSPTPLSPAALLYAAAAPSKRGCAQHHTSAPLFAGASSGSRTRHASKAASGMQMQHIAHAVLPLACQPPHTPRRLHFSRHRRDAEDRMRRPGIHRQESSVIVPRPA